MLVPTRFEERVVCKDGSEKWIDFNGGTVEYDGKPAVICVALDLTERRQMDEQLRLSQERVRLASESAGISSWEWDIRANQVIWSPEAYRIFGFEGTGSGMSFDQFLGRVHDDDRQRVRQTTSNARSPNTPISALNFVSSGETLVMDGIFTCQDLLRRCGSTRALWSEWGSTLLPIRLRKRRCAKAKSASGSRSTRLPSACAR